MTLKLTIESSAGTITKDYNENEPLKAVKISAMGQLHMDPSTEGNFAIVFEGNQLDESKKLKDIDIESGAILRIVPLKTVVV